MDNRELRERLEGLAKQWCQYSDSDAKADAEDSGYDEPIGTFMHGQRLGCAHELRTLLASAPAPAVTIRPLVPLDGGNWYFDSIRDVVMIDGRKFVPEQPAPPVEARAAARKWIDTWLATPGITPCNSTAREDDLTELLQAAERETMERLLRLVDETSLTGAVKNEIHYLSKRALARETPAKESMGTCSLISKPHPQSSCGKAWRWRPSEKKS